MNRERVKTLILSVLIMMSILLTGNLWFPSPMNILRSEAKGSKDNNLIVLEGRKSVISPNAIIVSFGAGDRKKNHYTVLSSHIDFVWDQSKEILKDYFVGDPEINLVNKEIYIQNNILKSIELEFPTNMSSVLMASIFDSLESNIVKDIKSINKILIPALNKGVIYIVENNQSIFEVKLSKYKENSNLINFIDELDQTEYIKYHPIFSLFDELNENYTPMPINYSVSTAQTFVESEININNEAMLIERSKKFFNENFDFVKTIKETSGAVVYIYGYGEKSVRMNNKGTIEYNEQVSNTSSTSVLTSLDAAIDFISKNGGVPKGAYLKDIKNISKDENKGYQFSFGYRIEGFPIDIDSSKMSSPMEIEVYGNKVKAYRSLIRNVMDIHGISPEQTDLYFPNIIEKNMKHLKLQYFTDEHQSMEEISDEEKILEILKNIEEVRIVYLDTLEQAKGQLLMPCWMIKIKGDIYYFDSYSGEIINKNSV